MPLPDLAPAASFDHTFASPPAPRLGLTFTLQDYLGLAAHPAIRAAAISALGTHRLVGTRPGLTAPVLALEERLATFLGLPAALTFPSGAEAIRQTLRALLRPADQVIADAASHPAVFETVRLSRAQLLRSPAGSVEGIERRLARLSRQPRRGRLFITLPAVSAQSSRIADLAEISTLARQHGAILVVDSSHDIGAMAPLGGGIAEIQSCQGRIDILVGSLAKSFGASGGFAAFRDPALKTVLQPPYTAALSPVNAAAILAALQIIRSPEGQRRRRNLHNLSLRLRNHLMADGIRPMGQASPFVPIRLPLDTALPRTALLESAGPRVPLIQAPVVPLHAPRWRIQLTADHSPADIDDLAELIRDVSRAFARAPARSRVPA